MTKKDTNNALCKTWYRATEEETETEKVYRPVPPSGEIPSGRGREIFTLNEDGSLIEGAIAPTDARTETQGVWKLTKGHLTFHSQAETEPSRVMEVAALKKIVW